MEDGNSIGPSVSFIASQRLDSASDDPKSHIRVLYRDAEPVGYYWFEERAGGVAFLLDVFIAPAWRRNGFGSVLLGDVFARARSLNLREVRLAVAADNAGARSLFSKFALEPVDEEWREGRRWLELRASLTPSC